MDAILISIQPKWVEKILNSVKTIEIRKTMPKCKLPCKVYIYCTKSKPILQYFYNWQNYKAISEHSTWADGRTINVGDYGNGKVVAEFTLNKVEPFSVGSWKCDDIEKMACLSYEEIINYFYKPEELDGNHLKWGYAWHIDELIIYDKPLPLKAFRHCQFKGSIYEGCCDNCHNAYHSYPGWVETREDLYDCQIESTCCNYLKKPPQSWCYVHELEVAHDN